jgi:3-methyl-2-oxobutanoate hydroxymethyltransferase
MKHSELNIFKEKGQKITCLTAYDASVAKLIDSAGVDIILIGDSLGMVIQGAENTRSVSMKDMLYHTKIVAKACEQSLVIVDMPFHSYDDAQTALFNAKELIKSGASMVKIEGGVENTEVIKTLVLNNINVCGHLGLQPQLIVDAGGYRVQGQDEKSAQLIIDNAKLLDSLGVSILVLECIPSKLAKSITNKVKIPTIGIGAGKDCDGQILVSYDMLGISLGRQPRFVRNFLNSEITITAAVRAFVSEVKEGNFPAESESY